MLRVSALLVVVALAGPSFVKVACEWTCARASALTAADAVTSCHDHGPPQSDASSLAAGLGCHDLSVAAIVAIPQAMFGTTAPVIARAAHVDSSGGALSHCGGASVGPLPLPSHPPAPIPLRI